MTGARNLAALGRLVAGGAAEPDGDAALLARFTATADEAAFAALARRHGPMVTAVCRRHLRQTADVDDAVQATFLVLARQAGAVHTAVGPFLYRVAERTAWRLRRTTRRSEPLPELPAREGLPADVRTVVADELGRLPETYRLVVELCHVAGYSTAEAAARLGWPKGTVLTRLAWARKRLRANLSRRGVTLGGSLAAVLADRAACGLGPRVAVGGGSERVLSLSEGVIRAMTLTKLTWAAGLAAVAVAATGVAVGAWAVGQPLPIKPPAATKTAPPAVPPPPLELPPAVEPPPLAPEPIRGEVRPTTVEFAPTARKTYTVAHPAGAFVREFAGGERIRLQFDDDRLAVTLTAGEAGKGAEGFYLEADYAMNKEGVVFGVITALEQTGVDGGDEQSHIGAPFAVRVRVDGDTLTVTDVRFGPVTARNELPPTFRGAFGRYTAANGAPPPTRKPIKPTLGKPAGGPPAPKSPAFPPSPGTT